jgi:hypothetical protein
MLDEDLRNLNQVIDFLEYNSVYIEFALYILMALATLCSVMFYVYTAILIRTLYFHEGSVLNVIQNVSIKKLSVIFWPATLPLALVVFVLTGTVRFIAFLALDIKESVLSILNWEK